VEKIILNGHDLTLEQMDMVVNHGAFIEISAEAKQRLLDTRQLVFDLVDSDVPIYGFNTGVGWNKDKKVFKEFFHQYNENLIKSHCCSVGKPASLPETRAAMLARLNCLLVGCTGLSPEIPQMYADMLNRSIHPVIPERGSVGEADIVCLSHIGLAMIGEGEVAYKDKVVNAKEAFKAEGLECVVLGPKDGLAIVSSNSFAAGQAALVLIDIREMIEKGELIYAMSLEALNGNTSPLDPETSKVRPYKGLVDSSANIRKQIEGSYIYNPDPDKPVQDPLSFRNAPHVFGALRDAVDFAEKQLLVQLNSSDDNPCLSLEQKSIMSCANFEPLPWVQAFEMLAVSIAHVSKSSCMRIIKIGSPEFTKLNRFLSVRPETICFGTVQKIFANLHAEICNMCNPVSFEGMPLAGDIEDVQTNAPLVAQKLRRIVDNLKYIYGLEIMHYAQAMDLRTDKCFGVFTKTARDELRKKLDFYDYDRNVTKDVNAAYEFVKSDILLDITKK
jgi:histidine ammonia-lyase